jgi:hypothetical protein
MITKATEFSWTDHMSEHHSISCRNVNGEIQITHIHVYKSTTGKERQKMECISIPVDKAELFIKGIQKGV